ncbi:MAG: hypothetical protein ABEJ72_03025 [Candidatus Aenigmatarchaeota archaeon]
MDREKKRTYVDETARYLDGLAEEFLDSARSVYGDTEQDEFHSHPDTTTSDLHGLLMDSEFYFDALSARINKETSTDRLRERLGMRSKPDRILDKLPGDELERVYRASELLEEMPDEEVNGAVKGFTRESMGTADENVGDGTEIRKPMLAFVEILQGTYELSRAHDERKGPFF